MYSPTLQLSLNITIMSLMGLPLMSGFYSKDLIIEFFMNFSSNLFIFPLTILSVGLTASFFLRLLSFSTKFILKSNPDKFFSTDKFILFPILFMIPMSISLGLSVSWLTVPSQFILIPMTLKILIPSLVLLGFSMGLILSFNKKPFLLSGETFSSLWYMNFLSSFPPIKSVYLGELSSKLDKSWTEISSASGSLLFLSSMSKYPDLITKISLCSLTLLLFSTLSFIS